MQCCFLCTFFNFILFVYEEELFLGVYYSMGKMRKSFGILRILHRIFVCPEEFRQNHLFLRQGENSTFSLSKIFSSNSSQGAKMLKGSVLVNEEATDSPNISWMVGLSGYVKYHIWIKGWLHVSLMCLKTLFVVNLNNKKTCACDPRVRGKVSQQELSNELALGCHGKNWFQLQYTSRSTTGWIRSHLLLVYITSH